MPVDWEEKRFFTKGGGCIVGRGEGEGKENLCLFLVWKVFHSTLLLQSVISALFTSRLVYCGVLYIGLPYKSETSTDPQCSDVEL